MSNFENDKPLIEKFAHDFLGEGFPAETISIYTVHDHFSRIVAREVESKNPSPWRCYFFHKSLDHPCALLDPLTVREGVAIFEADIYHDCDEYEEEQLISVFAFCGDQVAFFRPICPGALSFLLTIHASKNRMDYESMKEQTAPENIDKEIEIMIEKAKRGFRPIPVVNLNPNNND